ncbi:MAG TPA: dihydrodipicolinate synthase family protein [Candidatus Dormibacteraeota bacterium]|nr:dihydrodipicolinate synthase family protein [Candidatus Dormibacteraeota bacterium]
MINGIIPAVVLPMDSSSNPDYDDYKKYLQWVKSAGVTGVAVNADTGEGTTLTDDERFRVIEAAREAVGSNIMVIAGITGTSTDSAVRAAKDAKRAGASAGLVLPNQLFAGIPLDPKGPVDYHRRISDEADLDIFLFQFHPSLGGIEYSVETLTELSKLKRTVAIKEALFDARKFAATLRLFRAIAPKVSFLTGNGSFVYESFILGCDGALTGFATLPVKDLVKMFELTKKSSFTEAGEIWARLSPLADVMFGPPVSDYRARTKFALAELGVINPKSVNMRPPLQAVSESEKAVIRRALKAAQL